MTRRTFISSLLQMGAVAWIAGIGLARHLSLHQAVRADRLDRYPGKVIPLGNVETQAKWSG
jgi:hypothetical protein